MMIVSELVASEVVVMTEAAESRVVVEMEVANSTSWLGIDNRQRELRRIRSRCIRSMLHTLALVRSMAGERSQLPQDMNSR